jgi:hypothetical protein
MVYKNKGCTWNVSDDVIIQLTAHGSFTSTRTTNYTDIEDLEDAFSAWVEYTLTAQLVSERYFTNLCKMTLYKKSSQTFEFVIILQYKGKQLKEHVHELVTNVHGIVFSFVHKKKH